jgi:hypothetical protein
MEEERREMDKGRRVFVQVETGTEHETIVDVDSERKPTDQQSLQMRSDVGTSLPLLSPPSPLPPASPLPPLDLDVSLQMGNH